MHNGDGGGCSGAVVVLRRVDSLDIQRVDYRKREKEREKGRDKRRRHLQPVTHDVGHDPCLP
jgi:hypothetical protein